MRVELIYSPGCNTYKKALDVLETVIAEERLPIAIEMQQVTDGLAPVIRVNGTALGEPSHDFDGDHCSVSKSSKLIGSGIPCLDQLRSLLRHKWTELTAPAV